MAQACPSRCSVHGGIVGVLAQGAIVTAVNTHIHDVRPLGPPLELPGDRGGVAITCIGSRLSVRAGSVRRCVLLGNVFLPSRAPELRVIAVRSTAMVCMGPSEGAPSQPPHGVQARVRTVEQLWLGFRRSA